MQVFAKSQCVVQAECLRKKIGSILFRQIIIDARRLGERRLRRGDLQDDAAGDVSQFRLRAAVDAREFAEQLNVPLEFGLGEMAAANDGAQTRAHKLANFLRHARKIETFDETVDDLDVNFAIGKGRWLQEGIHEGVAGVEIGLLNACGELIGFCEGQPAALNPSDQSGQLILEFRKAALDLDAPHHSRPPFGIGRRLLLSDRRNGDFHMSCSPAVG